MIVVNNVEAFAKHNEEDIRRYLTNGKKIFDPEMVNDIIQNFYMRMIRSCALSKFDPELASFDTYVLTMLCRMLPYEKRRNPRARYSHVSSFSNPEGSPSQGVDELDIFELVYNSSSNQEFSVMRKNMPSCVNQKEEDDCVKHMLSFIDYVKASEPNKKKADKMVCFLEHKMQGCLATDIARMLGVSDNMVKIMKNSIYDKYKKWDTPKLQVLCLS